MKTYPEKAKVLIINPGKDPDYSQHEPINMGILAAYLEKHNHIVKIADEFAGQDVIKILHDFDPDLVAITGTTPVITYSYEYADYCREKGYTVAIGGVHASIFPEEAYKHANIVVTGEGEIALIKILKENIREGILEGEPIANLDDVPMPSRHLMDMEFYVNVTKRIIYCHLHFTKYSDRLAGVLFTRGCPFNCIYCHNSWKGLKLRFNSPDRVIEEIQFLKKEYQVTSLFFMDDDFFASRKRTIEVLEKMIAADLNLRWGCQARAKAIDEKTLELAYKAGCRQISFGIESGSQRILDLLKNKTTKVEDNAKAIELCRNAGITPVGSFMIGNPGETIEDIELTQKFIRDNKLYNANVNITTPFPGTKLWDICKEKNLLPEKVDWKVFTTSTQLPFNACDTIPSEEVERLRWKIIREEVLMHNKFKYFSSLAIKGLKQPIKTLKKLGTFIATSLKKGKT